MPTISDIAESARKAAGLDARYFKRHKFPKRNIRIFTFQEPKLMRQEFPELSKEEHEERAKFFAGRREYYAQRHGNLRRALVRKYGLKNPVWQASGTNPHFNSAEDMRLMRLARLACDCSEISDAHWRAAGRRKQNPFIERRVYVYTK